ncbi:MAG: putative quinol monooxygenase [Acidimicrobiales bacterium]
MVIVGGSFEVEPDRREEFLAGRLDAMRASRAETGCLEYAMSADPVEPSRVLLFERWASQEDLDAHLAALATSSGSSGRVNPISASIAVYDVAGERQLGG